MAYQPKSYKKFVATAATATLVATAIVPVASAADAKSFKDVSKTYQEAVNYLVTNDIAQGKSDTMFGTSATITRGDAAVMIAKAMKLDTAKAPSAGFTDVNARVGGSVNALVAAGVVSGKTAKTFAPDANITRQEMAKIITNAYKLEAGSTKNSFKDVNSNWDGFVDALLANGVTVGKTPTTFAATSAVTRGEFALFVFRSENLAPATPSVVSVSATNPNTLTLTGTGLKGLKVSDITLASNEVATVTASTDGKTAAVTFKNNFTLDVEQTVVVAQEGTKEFKFKYSLAEIKTVSLKDSTYDDDTVGQVLAFTINAETTTTSTEFLRQAGYTVNFVSDTGVFSGASKTSATGVLDSKIAIGKYTVQIQISKGGAVVASDTATITIADVESATSAINVAEFTNGKGFVHNSSTLVTGETASITYLEGNAAGKTDAELSVTDAVLTSSNPAVISVAGQTLSANAKGTATITVKVGGATKTYNFTVENTSRAIAKATPTEAVVKVIKDSTPVARTIQVSTVDQYGDPIAVDTTAGTPNVKLDLPKDNLSADLVTVNGGAAGELTTVAATGKTATGFAITPSAVGNGTILIKDMNNKVIGQIAVQVSNLDNVNVAAQKVEYTFDSARTTNSFRVGQTAKYQVSNFNTAGFFNGNVTLNTTAVTANEFYVESADTDIATVALVGTTGITVTGKAAGTTAITLKDANGIIKHQFNVTITAAPTVITKVDFKALSTINFVGKNVDVADILDVRVDAALDPIVYGVHHNKATVAKVRMDTTITGTVAQPLLYIDTDVTVATGLGIYNPATDILLGVVTAEVLTGSTTAIASTPIAPITNIKLGSGSYTTASKDKGSILFRVIADANNDGTFTKNEAITTTVLNVDVK